MFFLSVDHSMSLSSASVFFSILSLPPFAAKIIGVHIGDHFYVKLATSGIWASHIGFLFVGGSGLHENYIPKMCSYLVSFLDSSVLYSFGYGA